MLLLGSFLVMSHEYHLHEQWQRCGVLLYHVAFQYDMQEAGVGAVVYGCGEGGGCLLLDGGGGARCLFEQRQGIVDGPTSGCAAVGNAQRGKAVFEQGGQRLRGRGWAMLMGLAHVPFRA